MTIIEPCQKEVNILLDISYNSTLVLWLTKKTEKKSTAIYHVTLIKRINCKKSCPILKKKVF